MKEKKSPFAAKSKSISMLHKWVCCILLGVLSFSLAVVLSDGQAYSADTSGSALYAVSPLRQQMMLSQPSPAVTGGRGFMMPLTVVAKDAEGKPLAGIPVTFEVSDSKIVIAQMRGYESRFITATTDANGMASCVNTYTGYVGEGYQLYSLITGSIENLQVKASVPGLNTITFTVQVGTYRANLVDNTPPLMSVSAKDDTGAEYIAGKWTNHTVTVTYEAKDTMSAIKSCTPEQVFSDDGANMTSTGTAVDSANNTSTLTFSPICVDKSPPSTNATLPNAEAFGWYNKNVPISFGGTDSYSGVESIYYRIGNGEEIKLPGPSATAVVELEGSQEIYFYAVDKAGNIESTKTVYTKLDKSPPEVACSVSPESYENGWNDTNVTVTLKATDIYSNVKEIHYKIGETGTENIVQGTQKSFMINTEGITDVIYWAIDRVGNSSTQQCTQVKIDKTNPAVYPPKDITVEATAVKTPLNIGIATVEDMSDVELTNDAPVDGFPVGVTFVTWKARDKVGNMTSAVQTITVKDTIAPVLTVQGDIVVEATGVGTKVSLPPAKATDIFPVAISNDSPEEFPVGETLVTWTAEDANKNITKATEKVIVIDSTKPVLTVPDNMTIEAIGRRTPVNIGQALATDIFKVDITNNAPIDYPVGKATVTWKATDANGNVTTKDQIITVQDTKAPDLVIPEDITIEATDRKMVLDIGQATATDIFNVTVSSNAPEYYTIGTTHVIWKAVDENGNVTTKVQNITVTDKTKPVITRPADIKVEATGILTPVQIQVPEAYDIFPIVISSNCPETKLFPIGTTIIKWKVIDENGNESIIEQRITVVDTTKPLLTVPKDVKVEATGIRTPVNIGQAIASDIFSVDIKNNAPNDYPIGTTKVIWTATDANGNITIGYQNVTVEDTTKPVLSVPGDKKVEATAIRTPVDPGIATAKDIFPVTIKNDAPADYPIGTTPITWTATDENQNADTKVQNITIVDTTKPLLIIPDDITIEATQVRTPVDIGKAEAKDIFPVEIKNNAPADFPVGITKVIWTATDANGNQSEALQNVIVKDTTKPVLTIPNDITLEATAKLTPVDIGKADAKDIFPVEIKNNAPEAYPLGTTVVTWTATDANGNAITKTQNITITDKTCPILEVPEDITKEATAILTPADIGQAIATDIFDPSTKNDAPQAYPLGTTVVTWTATDTNGNTTTKTQRIRIVDTTPPELNIPGDITKEATAILTPVDIGQASAKDIFDVKVANNIPEAYPVGTTEVTWTATDANGNSTTKVQKITITDTTKPTLKVPEDIKTEATAINTPVDVGIAEATDIFEVNVKNDAPETFPIGTTEVTWTATDANGNVTTAVQKVTIQDTTKPLLLIPDDITTEATAVNTPVAVGDPKATDIFKVEVKNNAPEAFPIGLTEVTWTATDENGNVTTAVQKVTIQDTTKPLLLIPDDITTEATAVNTPVVIGTAEATDIFKVEVKNNAPEAFPIGLTEVTWTATDENGNVTTAVQKVTIQDTTKPLLLIPDDITTEATAVNTPVAVGDATATDIFKVEVKSDAPETFPIGTTEVTWTATDENGNVTTAVQKVTIQDTTKPLLLKPDDITTEATAVNTPVIIAEATATDIFKVEVKSDAPETFPIGLTEVTWTATDENGNVTTAVQKVTVQDTTKPELVIPKDITTEATAVNTPVTVGTAEATDIFKVEVKSDAPETFPIGLTEVTWTATDENGNEATAVQKVTIQDTTKPELVIPKDITTEATAVNTPVVIGTAEATDIFKVEVKSDAPEAFPIGTTEVTWTATDENGNAATAVQKVTIQDTTKPVISVPQDITTEATAVNTPVPIGTAEATDIFKVEVKNNAPEAFPIGTTEVTWTATDENGNAATAVQKVTIQDTTKPVMSVPQEITTEATAIKTPVEIGKATAYDIFHVDITNDGLLDYPINTTKVTWTATDANGNVTTGYQNVTIIDTTKPKLTVPENITVEATAVRTPVSIGRATATDIFPIMLMNDAPKDYPIGKTIVTWMARDINGNESQAEQYITVKDTTPPVLKIPADITVAATGSRTKVLIGTATATDIFGANVTNDAPADFPVGKTAVTWTATDANGNITKAVQYINVVQKYVIKSFNANTNTTSNAIEPKILLENTGDTQLKLSDLKIRYYFTSEGDKYQLYWCDYAQIAGTAGSRNVTSCVKGSFAKLSGTQCDHYLEISFSNSTEVLKPGEKVVVQGRFAKIDWSSYTQTNDYSFNPTARDYTETSKITVYSSGNLIGGIEP
ncbi:HYR domain-containing protein [Clostridium sp. BNL1100]|uniref:HYR domain-containing protein n=1 Tax=Clostridium sp. BNL1100 TaxID=755731 RepID=UPI00024A738F|nr:HYR domain-containing protein [Clostridium sp. BNL1100]AEY65511.1 HYR domain-containing protein,Cellulose binding domain-containing protein [Clostridium sp. BNL1100]